MRFVLATCYPSYSQSRHEVCPVVEAAHHVLYAVQEHGNIEFPALQLVYNMARESMVCRERIVNVCEVKMVKQNRELLMTLQKLVYLDQSVDKSETFLLWYCQSLLRAFEFA
jgi:hypothetical protein